MSETSPRMLRRYGAMVAQLVFPPGCLLCHAPVNAPGTVCPACFGQLHMISAPLCQQCGDPFAYHVPGETRCATCEVSPPVYDQVRAVWRYESGSAAIVKQLKFYDKTQSAPYLAGLMYACGSQVLADADVMAAVPLHPRRLRQRRYNQSLLLARALARVDRGSPEVPLLPDVLVRRRDTPAQTRLEGKARRHNVRDAFAVPEATRAQLDGRHVVLIDDVVTTGATVNACALALKKAGAAHVSVLALAKRVLEP